MSAINHFLTNFVSRPASALPKGGQWAIAFTDLSNNNILEAINKAYDYEPDGRGSMSWNTTEAAKVLLTPNYQEDSGCLFAQAIMIPGDGIQTNPGGNIQYNGFVRGRVGAGRNDFNPLKITFLDTNISFVDCFLRGWALATANFGLIARPQGDPLQYRMDLLCFKYGVYNLDTPPFITQQYRFKDVCCISVSDEEYNYTPQTGGPVLREAEFIYNSYSVNSENVNENVLDNKPKVIAELAQEATSE
jgi:hypothetical protein